MQFIRKLFTTISLIALILSLEVSSLNLRNKYQNNNLSSAIKSKCNLLKTKNTK